MPDVISPRGQSAWSRHLLATNLPSDAGKNVSESTSLNFWHEFLRVQSDKIILLMLIAFLHYVHADEQLKYVIGALIVLIQGQRFKT